MTAARPTGSGASRPSSSGNPWYQRPDFLADGGDVSRWWWWRSPWPRSPTRGSHPRAFRPARPRPRTEPLPSTLLSSCRIAPLPPLPSASAGVEGIGQHRSGARASRPGSGQPRASTLRALENPAALLRAPGEVALHAVPLLGSRLLCRVVAELIPELHRRARSLVGALPRITQNLMRESSQESATIRFAGR
jgi:hypothetical protein